jgi:hypothetical protein
MENKEIKWSLQSRVLAYGQQYTDSARIPSSMDSDVMRNSNWPGAAGLGASLQCPTAALQTYRSLFNLCKTSSITKAFPA